MASVVLHDVAKRYGDNPPVITGINLEIQEREFMVLVGPSGCGKSTLLRMVAGLEEITSGTIEIGGRVVNDVPPKDRDIAMVFQSYALYPHMNVRENLEFGLKIRGTPAAEIDRMVNDAAKILGLEGLLERRPKDLSGGQRQRVALGRAIVREPAVFLFDEPLANLDAKLRVQMRAEIKRLHQSIRTTSVYVTHDQVEAMTLGDRLIVMNAGRAEQIGAPMEVYENPATLFVAGFMGSPSMNFLRGEATTDGRFVFDGGAALDFRGTLPGPLAPGNITLGIRPEHLEACSAADAVVAAQVEMVEALGADNLAHVRFDGQALIARLPHHLHPEVGATLHLRPQAGRWYAFDTTTGSRAAFG